MLLLPPYRVWIGAILGILFSLSVGILLPSPIAHASPALPHLLNETRLDEVGALDDRLAQNGRVPLSSAAIDRLRQDLSRRTKRPAATFKVIEATPKTWSDGCLGLRSPSEICTEALVAGWRVVLSNGKQRWVYRTDNQALNRRLESHSSTQDW